MKLQHSSKFKIPKKLNIGQGEKDDSGFTLCKVNEDSPIAVELDSVVLKNGESSYSVQLQKTLFSDNIPNLESKLLTLLQQNCEELFKKQFPLEKFQKAYTSPLKVDTSELTLNINADSKVLDQYGNDIKNKIEQFSELEGRCILKLNCLRFITTYIYSDWDLIYFKQSSTYDEDTSDNEENPEVVEKVQESQEESFF